MFCGLEIIYYADFDYHSNENLPEHSLPPSLQFQDVFMALWPKYVL